MAALGWILNLGFAGGQAFVADSRVTTFAGANRSFVAASPDRSGDIAAAARSSKPPARTDCVVGSPDRTFTPADN